MKFYVSKMGLSQLGCLIAALLGPIAVSKAAGPAVVLSSHQSTTPPTVELLGLAKIPGTAIDRSGLLSDLEDHSPANRLGGFSAIEYTGHGDRFILLSDRGAGDGAVSFPCRMHVVDLQLAGTEKEIRANLVSTVLLTASDGSALNGSEATSFVDRSQLPGRPWHAMDPEGIRRWGDGWLISDEYGPHLAYFNRTGGLEVEWKLPTTRCSIGSVHTGDSRDRAHGFARNRGLEGLAVTPSQKTVWASFQSSLHQDGELVDGKCFGDFTRWIAFDRSGRTTMEAAYPMENQKTGISELLAIDEHRMLVLERDGKSGDEARIKRIFLANTRGASDVSHVAALPKRKQTQVNDDESITPVRKTLLIDLMDARHGLGDAATAEKPEGLAWGRPLNDGRRTLWICWDNDFDPNQESIIACFAIKL